MMLERSNDHSDDFYLKLLPFFVLLHTSNSLPLISSSTFPFLPYLFCLSFFLFKIPLELDAFSMVWNDCVSFL